MKSIAFIFALALLGVLLPNGGSVAVAGAAPQDDAFAVKAARIYTLTGAKGYVTDGWMEIRGGKIVSVGDGEPPSDLDVVDVGDASIIPGLVSTHLRSFGGGGSAKLGARWIAADGFDPYGDHIAAWSQGITSARLAPAGRAFVGGVSSTVKLGGTPADARVMRRITDLQIAFDGSGGRNAAKDGEIPFPSSSDVPIVPAEDVRPQGRLGRIQALEDILSSARDQEAAGRKAEEFDPRLAAFTDFLRVDRPFRIDARRSVDILEALAAGRRTRIRFYLAGADEAALVVEDVASANVPVVVEMRTRLDRLAPATVDEVNPWRRDVATAAKLHARGVKVVLAGETDDLLLAAQLAAGGGLDRVEALRAVTSQAAELLGISSSTGSLVAGKDADFAVVNGDPFSSRSHVQETWVEGKRVWWRKDTGGAVVVRAGKVYDGTGNVYVDGEVLIDDGKVVACGHAVGHPANARIIDAGADAVVTPGFIDLHGHTGLGSSRGTVNSDIRIADGFVVTRPEAHELARAGVTTVVAAPRSVGSTGAQMAVVKTWGRGHDQVVSKALGGLKVRASGNGEATEKALKSTLDRAKKYHDAWVKYHADLAKWKAEQAKKATDAPAATEAKKPEAKKPADPKDDPISGTWEGKVTGDELPMPLEVTMRLKLAADKSITGEADLVFMGNSIEGLGTNGKLDGEKVTLEFEPPTDLPIPGPPTNPKLEATLDKPDHMKGTVDVGVAKVAFEADRTSKGAPVIKVGRAKKAAKPTGGPKKPKTDPKLEPWRRVFEGKIGVYVETSMPSQVRAVAKVFSGHEIVPVVRYPNGMHHVFAEAKDKVSVAVSTVLTRSEKRETVLIPDELERAGFGIGWASNAEAGAAGLPSLARAAVRAGMSPDAALRALTHEAAKLLKIDDVVGSLTRGRDGDLLIFDGEPLEASSRLKTVIIRGKEVH